MTAISLALIVTGALWGVLEANCEIRGCRKPKRIT